MFALLGPNGAGKTTTVEILEGYRKRDGGEVRVLGEDPGRAGPAFRARIGIVLQSSAVYPTLSVREILDLFAGYYPHPRDRSEVIELVGLSEKAGARVRTLSGGQLRRLDLGLALVGDPELVFLDEPTTGFDPGARRQAWETIRGLRTLGKSILLTTHYMEEAQTLADRVAILRDGRIVATGTPAELLAGESGVEISYRLNGEDVTLRTTDPDSRPPRADNEGTRRGAGARTPPGAAAHARRRLPRGHGGRGMRLFVHELRAQQLLFWRSREAAFFTFLLPIIFLVLLGSVYGDEQIEGIGGSTYLLAGLIGYGVVATAFAGLAITLVVRRESGVLKRVRGTPLPASLYLSAVIISTLVVIALEVVTQLLIGTYVLDASWPAAPAAFALVLVIGAAAFAALGLALTGLVRSADGSSAVVNAIYLPMTFISGVFFSPEGMPAFLQTIGNLLPLTYLLRLFRETFVAGDGLDMPWGSLAAITVWGVVGFLVAVRMFKWEPREV